MEEKVFSASAKVAVRGGDNLGEKRKVIVDGKEFEVYIENAGNTYTATVEGREFKIEVPHAPQALPKRAPRSGKKKSGKISANIPVFPEFHSDTNSIITHFHNFQKDLK